jgi:hypothetical protein
MPCIMTNGSEEYPAGLFSLHLLPASTLSKFDKRSPVAQDRQTLKQPFPLYRSLEQ